MRFSEGAVAAVLIALELESEGSVPALCVSCVVAEPIVASDVRGELPVDADDEEGREFTVEREDEEEGDALVVALAVGVVVVEPGAVAVAAPAGSSR